MKRKFKILLPLAVGEPDRNRVPYRPPPESMVVMNGSGVFFLFHGTQYYPSIRKLSDVLHKYDVVWKEV